MESSVERSSPSSVDTRASASALTLRRSFVRRRAWKERIEREVSDVETTATATSFPAGVESIEGIDNDGAIPERCSTVWRKKGNSKDANFRNSKLRRTPAHDSLW